MSMSSSDSQTNVPLGALYPPADHEYHQQQQQSSSSRSRSRKNSGDSNISQDSNSNMKNRNHFQVTYTGPILKMHGEFSRQLRELARSRSGGRSMPGDADCCAFNKRNFIYLHKNSRKDISAEDLERNKRQVIDLHEEQASELLVQDANKCHRRDSGADDAHFLKALVTAAVNFQKSHDMYHNMHQHQHQHLHVMNAPNDASLEPLPDNFASRILRSADAAARVHHQARSVTVKKAENYEFVLKALWSDVDSFVPALGHRKTLDALSKLDLWKVSK